MNPFAYLVQDWKANRRNPKGQTILLMFRLAQLINRSMVLKIIFCWYLLIYMLLIDWVMSIELPRKLTAGKGLIVYHGQALVVNQNAIIGDYCVLRNSVTIGHKQLADGSFTACPRIGNYVDIGANVCIIGDVIIGDHVTIGAGAVVVKSLPANSIAVGNPARVLRMKNEDTAIL